MEIENKPHYDHASAMAGEYIESIGKTDMAAYSVDEWYELINVIVKGYFGARGES